jgi:hypothetical protein
MFNSLQDGIPGLDDLLETFKLLTPIHRKMVLGHARHLLNSQPDPDPDHDPDFDPDPEPVIKVRPSYRITEAEAPAQGNREVAHESFKEVAC